MNLKKLHFHKYKNMVCGDLFALQECIKCKKRRFVDYRHRKSAKHNFSFMAMKSMWNQGNSVEQTIPDHLKPINDILQEIRNK